MGTFYKKTFTKLSPANAKIFFHLEQWLDKADELAEYLGLELVKKMKGEVNDGYFLSKRRIQ